MTIKTEIKDIASQLGIGEDNLELFYKASIDAVMKEYNIDLAIDGLNEIIISDHLNESIKVYQREHKLLEEVTENEFGSVFGKTIHDKKTGEQAVFLSAYDMLGLLDNDTLNKTYQNNEDLKEDAFVRRDHLINLLIHELSHVEYNSHVNTKTGFCSHNSFDSYHEGLGIIMFEEYYACRRSSEVSIPYHDKTLKKTIVDIEIEVEELVQKFRRYEINVVDFMKQFLENIQLALKYMCYLLGDIAASKTADDELKGTKIHSIIDCIKNEFDDLYKTARVSYKVFIPLSIRECVFKYYNMFKIDFVDDEYGKRIIYLDNR